MTWVCGVCDMGVWSKSHGCGSMCRPRSSMRRQVKRLRQPPLLGTRLIRTQIQPERRWRKYVVHGTRPDTMPALMLYVRLHTCCNTTPSFQEVLITYSCSMAVDTDTTQQRVSPGGCQECLHPAASGHQSEETSPL